jgi:chaperonin GroEL (HSP60 family)
MLQLVLYPRTSPWSFGFLTWWRQKARYSPTIQTMSLKICLAISDAVRTSLGPRGMDKMVSFTLLSRLSVKQSVDSNIERRGDCYERRRHHPQKHTSRPSGSKDGGRAIYNAVILSDPVFKLVDLSAAQDIEAGDGTTSVVVLAGSLLGAAEKMLQKGIHPTTIAESFLKASAKAVEYLTEISTPVDLNDKASLLRAASTSLNSKVSALSRPRVSFHQSGRSCHNILQPSLPLPLPLSPAWSLPLRPTWTYVTYE